MKDQAPHRGCPVCGFQSIYTDGDAPCSVRCALKRTTEILSDYSLSIEDALNTVKEEATFRGLPSVPDLRDLRSDSYRYIFVQEARSSNYWRIDRELLTSGFNVDYVWIAHDVRLERSRLYRFAPQLLLQLPDFMLDFKVTNLTDQEVYTLCQSRPSWCFLKAR